MSAPRTARRQRSDRGSAFLIVVFFAAVMLIAAGAATKSLLTEGRRQQEEDLIWRGNQYARAVKLFYRKNGRFPTSMDELTKPQNKIRFLRRAYEDPVNTEDGSWRLIYVSPSGQLIGSVRQGAAVGIPQVRPAGTGPQGTTPGVSAASISSPLSGGQLIGGNIIGVGSKVPKSSIKVYNGASIYREWEFIWDPARDAMQAGQPGVGGPQPGTPAGLPPPPPRRP